MPNKIHFDQRLIQGKFIKRYKRFFADVELENGEVITAHCANTGSMKSILSEGIPALISENTNPKAKLDYRLEFLQPLKKWVGVNTHRPNRCVYEWVREGLIEELPKFKEVKKEVTVMESSDKKSRMDLMGITESDEQWYIEVKNVTYRDEEGMAAFPDSVTERGQKHLDVLTELARKKGTKAVLFFFVQRSDCKAVRPADEIDEKYGQKLRFALDHGVKVLCYETQITPTYIGLGEAQELITSL